MKQALDYQLIAAVLWLSAAAVPAYGQSLRVHSTTTARYVELRPIRYDSAAGIFRADSVTSAAPLTQDVEVSLWGLGVPGLRAYSLMRGRAALGSGLVWPRSDDHYDLLVAFLEYERARYRLRAGRQHRASGLGWYAFDGLTATLRPLPSVRAEVYGGRGFARGFLEPVGSDALRALDPLRPEQGTVLMGASVWAAPFAATAITGVYQREILSDRSGLVSERMSLDARAGVGQRLLLTGSAEADLAFGTWGRARAGALARLGRKSFVEVEVFRYRPVLDLTTIWGVFAPQGHRGATVSSRVSVAPTLGLSAGYTYRRYEPLARGTPFLTDVDDEAQLVTAGARWSPGDFILEGGYRLQFGFGGAQSGGDIGVSWEPTGGFRAGLRGAAFQQEEAIRVADGTVYGVGGELRARLGEHAGVRADLMRYSHRRSQGQATVDWSQTRGTLAFDWWVGSNPDRAGAAR